MKDVRKEAVDKAIASHVVNLHMNKISEAANADVSIEDLKKYLTYAKLKISPRVSEEAGQLLQDL